MTSEDRNGAFSILIVCTGNVCRSPLAERLLATRLRGKNVSVRSAGTGALVYEDMTPETSALVERLGGKPGPHRAQQLTEALIAEADLVLTATRGHRSEVVSLLPRASRYTYTLTQFARLVDAAQAEGSQLSDDSVASLRRLVDDAAAMRGFVRPDAPEDDDIEDPYRRASEVYDRVGAVVDAAVARITAAMSPVGRGA